MVLFSMNADLTGLTPVREECASNSNIKPSWSIFSGLFFQYFFWFIFSVFSLNFIFQFLFEVFHHSPFL